MSKVKLKYVDGDLIKLAQAGEFDVIAHGCNCFCVMAAGLAPQMAKAFAVDRFPLEHPRHRGDKSKLGKIEYTRIPLEKAGYLYVFNAYTQYQMGHGEFNYGALRSCLMKIDSRLERGSRIGLPRIGAGLAGGDWTVIAQIIVEELGNHDVTIVNYV